MSAPAFQQFGLFDGAPRSPRSTGGSGGGTPIKPLRPYQAEAVRRIRERLTSDTSTLLVLPTGTGKTRTAAQVIKEWPGRVLWIAHRTELIDQARRALEEVCGEMVSTEKAEQRADGTRIVVASVQTLKGERLESFARRHPWTLMAIDEAHHAPNESYRVIRRARAEAKVFGLTATPDRSDERAMGQEFDSVALVYEIQDAIRDGFLCPIRIKQVMCGEIDLSQVSTVAGDLNRGELDAVMGAEKALHEIIAPNDDHDGLIDLAGDRPTAAFWTSVDAAHRAAEIINRYKPDSARAVDGTTAADTRRQLLKDFDAGRYQFICNVGVLTEGWDSPRVSCVAIARPTKSRSLYAQCAGRGLRTLPGKVDCLLLDFVGNSGKHRLCSALDILDGTWDDEVVEKARDILEAQGMDGMLAQDALEQAQKLVDAQKEREAAKRLKIQMTNVKRVVIERDPFSLLDVADPEADPRIARFSSPASDAQKGVLDRAGIQYDAAISSRRASALIDGIVKRRDAHLCTIKQANVLAKHGVPDAMKLSFDQAGRLMGVLGPMLKQGRWNWKFDGGQLASLLAREPGMEG